MSDATIALIGAGHAHLYVAARADALIQRGARVVLIDSSSFWYSGLATGMLSGAYCAADDQVDPEALITAHGGEFVREIVQSVDAGERRLHLANGTSLGYDYLSFNVGSRVNVDAIPGMAEDDSVWPVKPIRNLWALRAHLEARFAAGEAPRVAVVGGGPTGSEVAASIQALCARRGARSRVTLVTGGDRLITQMPAGAARVLARTLAARGVTIRTGTRIARREAGALICEDGQRIEADLVVPAVGLEANPLVHASGLPSHPKEGLRINAELRSIADERVFAGGDCASMDGFELPKLGVFGVRQASYIHRNLLASLEGRPLAEYVPQKRYLSILNLGDGSALSTWGPLWWKGRASMWLKDAIDRRFLEGYRRAADP